MNLFLAIMLGNFDKAKAFGQKKKVLDAYQELLIEQKDQQHSLFFANEVIFAENARYINEDILNIKKPKAFLNMAKLGGIFKAKGGEAPVNMLQGFKNYKAKPKADG